MCSSNQFFSFELSLYELQRKPQQTITDEDMEIPSTYSLTSELTCPICLDILKKTMTTKKCLHRFCFDCITTALRAGNKECPTCRQKLISKRCLRPDPNLDALIEKLYPNREEYEEKQREIMERINKIHSGKLIINNL